MRVYGDWAQQNNRSLAISLQDTPTLCDILCEFAVTVRNKNGVFYHKTTLVNIINGIVRYINEQRLSESTHFALDQISIWRQSEFLKLRKTLDGTLKKQNAGKPQVSEHAEKRKALTDYEVSKLQAKHPFNTTDPVTNAKNLQKQVFLQSGLCLALRGKEEQYELTCDQFEKTEVLICFSFYFCQVTKICDLKHWPGYPDFWGGMCDHHKKLARRAVEQLGGNSICPGGNHAFGCGLNLWQNLREPYYYHLLGIAGARDTDDSADSISEDIFSCPEHPVCVGED